MYKGDVLAVSFLILAVGAGSFFLGRQSRDARLSGLERRIEMLESGGGSSLDDSVRDSVKKKGENKVDYTHRLLGKPDPYLSTKKGFRFAASYDGDFFEKGDIFPVREGEYYDFEIDVSGEHAIESLAIRFYDKSAFPSTTVNIYDEFHEGIPSTVNIHDLVNNTDMSIYRNEGSDVLICEDDVSGEEVGALFRFYSERYVNFRIDADIDGKIAEYVPKIEINAMMH